MATRNRPHASFGIGAEQLLRMGELGPSLPAEQAVDRKISLDVVDEDQIGVLARKPGLLHNRGNHLLGAALDDALCEPYKDLDAILAEADLIIIGASNRLDMERGTYARRSTSCASLIQTPSPRPSSKSSRALCKSIATAGLPSSNLAWDCSTVS